MTTGWSERVRQIADDEYVKVARAHGRDVCIRLGDLKKKAKTRGFPSGHTEQIATAIESEKFWRPRGLKMISPKGQSRQVDTIFKYEVVGVPKEVVASDTRVIAGRDPLLSLVGILKNAFSEGADAFLREIRRDKEQKS